MSFPSNLGRAGKPFRLLYDAQLIKQRTQLSDRELVEAIRDAPAYQYFIGLPEYQPQAPFSFSVLSYQSGAAQFRAIHRSHGQAISGQTAAYL